MKSPSRFGTEACRALWAKQAGEASETARSALRDYAGFPDRQPNVPHKRSTNARIAAEPKLSAASGGCSEAEAGNRKERLRDYARFPDAEGDYCDSVNVAFNKLKLN